MLLEYMKFLSVYVYVQSTCALLVFRNSTDVTELSVISPVSNYQWLLLLYQETSPTSCGVASVSGSGQRAGGE